MSAPQDYEFYGFKLGDFVIVIGRAPLTSVGQIAHAPDNNYGYVSSWARHNPEPLVWIEEKYYTGWVNVYAIRKASPLELLARVAE